MPRPKRLTTVKRPQAPDLSWLPEELTSYFEGQGYVVSLDSMHETTVASNALHERYPLELDNLPEGEERAAVLSALRLAGCRQNTDNTFRKGDCYIMLQSVAAREAMHGQAAAIWRQQETGSVNAQQDVDNMNAMIGDLGIGRAYPISAPGITAYVNPSLDR